MTAPMPPAPWPACSAELEIAKALARHSVEIGLPKYYTLNHVVLEGKMRIVGIKAKKIMISCRNRKKVQKKKNAGRESWTGTPWGGCGSGFGLVPGYTTLSVRVRANT